MKSKINLFSKLLAAHMFFVLVSVPLASVQADTHFSAAPISDTDREMLPTTSELAIQANTDGDFTILFAALQAAGLLDVFNGEAHYTVFAPTDEAFLAIPQETLNEVGLGSVTDLLLEENKELLTAILLFHVTPGDWYAENLPTGVLRMLDDNFARVYWESEELKIEGASISDEAVTKNGVVHVIDAVILPPL